MALAHLGKLLAVDEDSGRTALHWSQTEMDHHFSTTIDTGGDTYARLSWISVVTRNGSCGRIRFEIPKKLKHVMEGAYLPEGQYLQASKEVLQKVEEWDNEIIDDTQKKDYFFVNDEN